MKIVIATLLSMLLVTVFFAGINYSIEGAGVASRHWLKPSKLFIAFLGSGVWVLAIVLPTALLNIFTRLNSKSWSWVSISVFSLMLPSFVFVTSSGSVIENIIITTVTWAGGICAGAIFIFFGILPLTRKST